MKEVDLSGNNLDGGKAEIFLTCVHNIEKLIAQRCCGVEKFFPAIKCLSTAVNIVFTEVLIF